MMMGLFMNEGNLTCAMIDLLMIAVAACAARWDW
jgi:hypothetical protein